MKTARTLLALTVLALFAVGLADHENQEEWEYARIQYEYFAASDTIRVYWVTPTTTIGPKTDEAFILRDLGASQRSLLDYAGSHGWELVAATEWQYVFKRPISGQP